MNLSLRTEDMQKQAMKDRSVLQNYLNIPMIEIEQLNPRVRALHGVQVVSYRSKGGDVLDDEPALDYEYDWVGGEIIFVENPYPRPPVGTGRVAFVADDEQDPAGTPVPLPEGTLSGSTTGWNKEFLASHYLENYWKIIDENFEAQVQERCFNILCNKAIASMQATGQEVDAKATEKIEAEARAKIEEAARLQAKGSPSMTVNVHRTTMIPQTFTRKITPEQGMSEIEKSPLFQQLQQQNKELQESVRKLTSILSDKGSDGNGKSDEKPKKGLTKEQRLENLAKGREKARKNREKKKSRELAGNLAG